MDLEPITEMISVLIVLCKILFYAAAAIIFAYFVSKDEYLAAAALAVAVLIFVLKFELGVL